MAMVMVMKMAMRRSSAVLKALDRNGLRIRESCVQRAAGLDTDQQRRNASRPRPLRRFFEGTAAPCFVRCGTDAGRRSADHRLGRQAQVRAGPAPNLAGALPHWPVAHLIQSKVRLRAGRQNHTNHFKGPDPC